MASILTNRDDQSDQDSTSSSMTPQDDKRRSWLSHLSSVATSASQRSSFSSIYSAATAAAAAADPFASPKPHKANQAAWEAMRRLRREVRARGGREVGLEHFRLLKRVGSGDLGSVYLCQIRSSSSHVAAGGPVGPANNMYAMKVVDREALAGRKKLGRAEVERDILCMLDHPFLPTLYAEFEASHYSCLVMEFCPGGDLYSSRLKQPSKRFSVSSTKFYAAEVLLAIEYLHMMGIIYRDLKPENVLVREDGHIMLSDFDLCLKCDDVVPKLLLKQQNNSHGHTKTTTTTTTSPPPSCTGPLRPVLSSCFSLRGRRRLSPLTTTITEHASSHAGDDHDYRSKHRGHEDDDDEYDRGGGSVSAFHGRWGLTAATELVAEPIEARSKSFVGTHEYLAPEVISGQGHGSAVDWWTFGVFLYEMLFGVTPFKGENNERTLRNILKQPLTFPASSYNNKLRNDYHRYCSNYASESDNNYEEEEQEETEKAKDLIRRLLVKNPKRRIGSVKGSVEIKKHKFFQGVNWALIRSVRPPVVPSEELKYHNNKTALEDRYCNMATVAKKYKMMMMNHGGRSHKSTSSSLFVLPRVLSKKERDQPYQIPFHHDHDHRRHYHNHRRCQHSHQLQQQQHFEYF